MPDFHAFPHFNNLIQYTEITEGLGIGQSANAEVMEEKKLLFILLAVSFLLLF